MEYIRIYNRLGEYISEYVFISINTQNKMVPISYCIKYSLYNYIRIITDK